MASFEGMYRILTPVPKIYKLPQSSLAELARNSVKQSGFEMEIKRHWLGNEWYLPGAAGNDINKVHVSFGLSPSLQTSLTTCNVDKCS
jgi:AMP deaminase